MKKFLFFLCLQVVYFGTIGQDLSPEIHSKIENEVRIIKSKGAHDTSIARSYIALSEIYFAFKIDTVIPLCEKAIFAISKSLKTEISTKVQNTLLQYLAYAYNNIGYVHFSQENNIKAFEYYEKCSKILKKLNNRADLANTINNIGLIFERNGEISKALENYHLSLRIYEEMKDERGIAIALTNIGYIYSTQGEEQLAMEYFKKSRTISEKFNDKNGIAIVLNNIANIYVSEGKINEALKEYTKSLSLLESVNNKEGVSRALISIAGIYQNSFDSVCDRPKDCINYAQEKAISFYKRSLAISKELNDNGNVAFTLSDIAYSYFKMKDYVMAKKYGTEGYDLAIKMNFPENIRNSANLLYKLYKATHKTAEALEMHEVWIKLRDSLRNKETERATIKSRFSYEYKTKSLTDSISNAKQIEVKNAELATKAAEIKAKRNLQIVLFVGLALVIVFAIFIFNRFKVTQKQKNIIEIKEQEAQKQNQIIMEQKHLVEEKQKEILDSIHYAKRIQRALLANESYIGKTINRLMKK